MVLRFLKTTSEPMAIDFGYASLKVLQLSDPSDTEPRRIVAAAAAEIPLEIRHDPALRDDFLIRTIPTLIRKGGFSGRVAVCSIPAWKTFVQHVRVPKNGEGDLRQKLIAQLQNTIACDPENLALRHVEVCDVNANGQVMSEVICFCLSQESVMRQINVLKRCKVLTGSLQAEVVAANEAFGQLLESEVTADAFKHLYRREGDDHITTAYVDVGASCVKVMIAHGTRLVFSKTIPFGGRHFDHRLATALRCELVEAHEKRKQWTQLHALQEQGASTGSFETGGSATSQARSAGNATSGGDRGEVASDRTTIATAVSDRRSGQLPPELEAIPEANNGVGDDDEPSSGTDGVIRSCLEEMWDHMADELQMCARYHNVLFAGRPIDRLFLMGGESRNHLLARHVGRAMNIPTYHADPFRRLKRDDASMFYQVDPESDFHGWAVPVGLCYLSHEE